MVNDIEGTILDPPANNMVIENNHLVEVVDISEFKPTKNFIKIFTPFMENGNATFSGYDICKLTNLRTGIVYPQLHELHAKSWLTAEWEDKTVKENDGPKRKLYQITGAGLQKGRRLIDTEFPFLRAAILATE